MANRQTLCLIDGSGYIFRAFYALPPMTRPDGTPINAVYGFTNMMMNLTEENNCTRMLVIFDAKRQNFRNQIYPHYKENRKETPPELIPQFALIRQACDALNIPWTEQEGYEADDLIATYADKAVKENIQVQIISADKDLMQLMRDGVSLYDPMKKKEIVDSDVMAKFGVSPDKIVDVQSLMGDAIDNVPGAEGIGPKTAAQLINQYGSLDNLLSHLEEIPQKKRREGLIRDRDQILISRQLVTLKSDVPNIMPLSDFSVKEPNFTQLRAFLTENGFKSLLARLQNWKPKCAPETINTCLLQPQKNYSLIQEESELKQWLSQIRDKVSIDTETTGLNPMQSKLVGFSLGIGNGQACYIPLRHGEDIPLDLFTTDRNIPKQIPISKVLALLKPILVNPDILKIGHNIKYDMHIIAQEYGPDFQIFPIDDTMVMSAVLNGSNHGHSLDELAKIYLNY
ncbi:MAG: 5'-3' exonuclease H3TH domain-containing protein, partial [Pseudomonadota bacterium]|nr:5'-3' exonuclease H3TH domain-containing protein [Pseudomonadota bacterium]